MATRTLLLGVDGALLVELASPERHYATMYMGCPFEPLPVPDDAVTLPGPGRDGRGPYFFRPAVIDGLRDLASAGVDIVWNTRWLASTDLLTALSERLGLTGAVRFPDAAELPVPATDTRVDTGPNVLWEHWKVRALVERARTQPAGDEVVIVDARIDASSRRLPEGIARRARRDAVVVGGIVTGDTHGLSADDVAALRAWAAGGAVPRR